MRGQKLWEESQKEIDNWINAFSLRRFLALKTMDGSWESVTFSIMIVEKNLIPVFDCRPLRRTMNEQEIRTELSVSIFVSLSHFSLSLSLSLCPFLFQEVCMSPCQLHKRQFIGRQNGGHGTTDRHSRKGQVNAVNTFHYIHELFASTLLSSCLRG